ncbi:MAG: hypothetical protein HY921_08255, partial [Elusimicrobia bacterium]|nr:hypothetical protein [Elusimicrobiota bacterium]
MEPAKPFKARLEIAPQEAFLSAAADFVLGYAAHFGRAAAEQDLLKEASLAALTMVKA